MLKYKDYKLIKPEKYQLKMIYDLIRNKDGSVFHEFELNKIVKEEFNTGFFYLVDNPKNIRSFSPIHITRNRFGLKSYHFKPLYDIPYAGFVNDETIEMNKISIGFFESFMYRGFPYKKEIVRNSEDERVGETTMVNLSLDEDEIFNKIIHSKRRNMIRKAIKSEISIEVFRTIDGLQLFWPMLDDLHKKLGYSYLTFDFYNKILQYYGKKKQAFILIAFKNKKPISGIFILGNRNYMHYYKGATSFGVKNEGQGELLQWEAIKISKVLGANFYDLCNLEKEKLPSIYRFKTGISSKILMYPKYNRNNLGFQVFNRIGNFLKND